MTAMSYKWRTLRRRFERLPGVPIQPLTKGLSDVLPYLFEKDDPAYLATARVLLDELGTADWAFYAEENGEILITFAGNALQFGTTLSDAVDAFLEQNGPEESERLAVAFEAAAGRLRTAESNRRNQP